MTDGNSEVGEGLTTFGVKEYVGFVDGEVFVDEEDVRLVIGLEDDARLLEAQTVLVVDELLAVDEVRCRKWSTG